MAKRTRDAYSSKAVYTAPNTSGFNSFDPTECLFVRVVSGTLLLIRKSAAHIQRQIELGTRTYSILGDAILQ